MIGTRRKHGLMGQRGVTLVEMLVAMTLFVFVMFSILDIFKMMLVTQRRVVSNKLAQDTIRYTMEVISKEVRNAQKVAAGDCADMAAGQLYAGGGNVLYFKNQDDICVRYSITNGVFSVVRYPIGTGIPAIPPVPLTSSDIVVTGLSFTVQDIAAAQQGRVTILINYQTNIPIVSERRSYKIQTTLTARYYYL